MDLFVVPLSYCFTQLSFATRQIRTIVAIVFTCPLQATYRLKARMNVSVSRDVATSMCTARTARQVNMTTYLLTRDLFSFTMKGPK